MYITYGDYRIMGGLIEDSTTFNRYKKRAKYEIDKRTFNRLKNQIIPEEVKDCMVEIIDFLKENNIDSSISSANNDGLSVIYKSKEEIENEISSIVDTYLANVIINNKKLTYRGVYADDNI